MTGKHNKDWTKYFYHDFIEESKVFKKIEKNFWRFMFQNNKGKRNYIFLSKIMRQSIIKRGFIIYTKYILVQNDEIRIMNFIGLCISKSNATNSIILQNIIKKEKIRFVINLLSPAIIKFNILKRYKKKFRLNKLYYK